MSPNKGEAPGVRIEWLDGWRGSAVLLMVAWHFCYDLTLFGVLPEKVMQSGAAVLLRYLIAGSFVLVSGICCRFSSNNLRRGLRLALWAAAVTAVSALSGAPIWFGILHLLALSACLYALAEKQLRRLPDTVGAGLCVVLFAAGLLITERVRVSVPGLWILGLRTESFVSADYYPLFPWLFLFIAGSYAGARLRESAGEGSGRSVPGWLAFPGRHALAVYLLHQPVLLGVLALITGHAPGA